MKVSIFVRASEPIPNLPTPVAPRNYRQADELAKALQGALSIEVPITEGPLTEAPADGYVLMFDTPSTISLQVAHRVVAMNEDRSSIMRRIEQHSFVAAIEKNRYFEWRTSRDSDRGYGLVGSKAVAARMSAHLIESPYTSTRYSLIESATAHDLPGLIAEYLKTHEAMASG